MSQEAWSSAGSRQDHDDTSDRLYQPEDLAQYAARRDGLGSGSRPDPLSDPLSDGLPGSGS